jgi:hypothetical protein
MLASAFTKSDPSNGSRVCELLAEGIDLVDGMYQGGKLSASQILLVIYMSTWRGVGCFVGNSSSCS